MYGGYGYGYGSSAMSGAVGAGIWGIISLVLAVVGAIVIYFLFLKPKKEYPNKFVNWARDFFNFDKMVVEVIVKITYLFFAIFITLGSFSLIAVNFFAFLLSLTVGNIVIRIVYEMLTIRIMIWKNTTEIKKELSKKSK